MAVQCRTMRVSVPLFNALIFRHLLEYHHDLCIAEKWILWAAFYFRQYGSSTTVNDVIGPGP